MNTQTKEVLHLEMPWETEYGYAQGVKSGNMAWLAGQVGHNDEGVLLVGMENQMRQAYSNASKLLRGFGMDTGDVVEEVLYVMDMATAFVARKKMGREVYADPMQVASTVIVVNGLALPGQLIEIKIIARK